MSHFVWLLFRCTQRGGTQPTYSYLLLLLLPAAFLHYLNTCCSTSIVLYKQRNTEAEIQKKLCPDRRPNASTQSPASCLQPLKPQKQVPSSPCDASANSLYFQPENPVVLPHCLGKLKFLSRCRSNLYSNASGPSELGPSPAALVLCIVEWSKYFSIS